MICGGFYSSSDFFQSFTSVKPFLTHKQYKNGWLSEFALQLVLDPYMRVYSGIIATYFQNNNCFFSLIAKHHMLTSGNLENTEKHNKTKVIQNLHHPEMLQHLYVALDPSSLLSVRNTRMFKNTTPVPTIWF